MSEALKYLNSLEYNKYYSFNKIPMYLFHDIWTLIEKNKFEGYKIVLSEYEEFKKIII